MSEDKKTNKKKSAIHAIVFASMWKTIDARKWLKTNNYKPIGRVYISKKTKNKKAGTKTFTILPKSDFDPKKKMGYKTTKAGISFVLGTLN